MPKSLSKNACFSQWKQSLKYGAKVEPFNVQLYGQIGNNGNSSVQSYEPSIQI